MQIDQISIARAANRFWKQPAATDFDTNIKPTENQYDNNTANKTSKKGAEEISNFIGIETINFVGMEITSFVGTPAGAPARTALETP